MRVLLTCLLICLGVGEAWAQKGATGPVADLNAEAKVFSDSAPERSLAVAQQAQTAARAAGDVRSEAEALNYVAYAYRQQSLLDLARTHGKAQGYNREELKDFRAIAVSLNSIGSVEALTGSICPSCFEGLYPDHQPDPLNV